MAATGDVQTPNNIDGWIGNPDMITEAVDPDQSVRPTRFHSFSLSRRIFLCTFISLSILLLGVIIVFQTQNRSLDLLRNNLTAQADFYKTHLQLRLNALGADRAGIEKTLSTVVPHKYFDLAVFTPDGTLVKSDAATASAETARQTVGGVFRLPALRLTAAAQFDSIDGIQRAVFDQVQAGRNNILNFNVNDQDAVMALGREILHNGQPVAFLILSSDEHVVRNIGAINTRALLSLFLIALLIALFLAAMTARSITDPLNDLARAAEIGKTANLSAAEAERLLIPNLSGRSDVVGRLANAMREMAQGLYNRIETNESFAADVAHEIKNPLASMQSAVDSLRYTEDKKSREDLLNILHKDVIRLDRLVSDISNASRLDSELVNEEMVDFELSQMIQNIVDFLRMDAESKKVEIIYEPPAKPVIFSGLEERLAQVFVNLITNSISFCKKGDAIRVWIRVRDNRILSVVEDTGPGIPEHSLEDIFRRFYSQRSEAEFGAHSGLGLAISKQIVEAHGGTIWAENIRNAEIDSGNTILGARFVVALPT